MKWGSKKGLSQFQHSWGFHPQRGSKCSEPKLTIEITRRTNHFIKYSSAGLESPHPQSHYPHRGSLMEGAESFLPKQAAKKLTTHHSARAVPCSLITKLQTSDSSAKAPLPQPSIAYDAHTIQNSTTGLFYSWWCLAREPELNASRLPWNHSIYENKSEDYNPPISGYLPNLIYKIPGFHFKFLHIRGSFPPISFLRCI